MPTRNLFTPALITVLFGLSFSCQPKYKAIALANSTSYKKNESLSKNGLKFWHLKDIEKDSLPGISLERAYTELLKKRKAHPIIVAVLDSEVNIKHKDLKNQIWVNPKEIPENGIDDDSNGYIDDIHGWNYIGTQKNDSVVFSSFSYTEIIKKYDFKYKNLSLKEVSLNEKKQYEIYQSALKKYNKELEKRKSNLNRYIGIQKKYNKSKAILNTYFLKKNYDQKQLDSLLPAIKDEEKKKYISYMKTYLRYDINNETLVERQKVQEKMIKQNLNIKHNGRYLTKDDFNDISDFPYGNNKVDGTNKISHGTKIVSLIASKINHKEVKGIIDTAQIMCLNTSTSGDEFDKDIALAIRYATDNGARVINMSFGKSFSLHPKWVKEAIIYAESKNVLVITSSGNDGEDLDKNYNYPNDALDDGIEYANNFLRVGATTHELDSTLVRSTSNYGKKEVDIFAPGHKINCFNWNDIAIDSGTSLSSAVVSGVAALIFSYYPNLTAAEVKEIIMESGLPIDIMVNKPSKSKEKEKVPFSSLSKSGKIVNAYNALIMADSISRVNKRK